MLIKECKWSLLLTTCAQVRLGNVSAISFSYGSEKRTLVKQVSGKLDHQLSFIEKKNRSIWTKDKKSKSHRTWTHAGRRTICRLNVLSSKCLSTKDCRRTVVDEVLSTKCLSTNYLVDEMLVDELLSTNCCRRNVCRQTILSTNDM